MTTTTNNIVKFPGEPAADIETACAEWLVRMESGALTLGELAEFEYWRAASPDRDRVYAEMSATWERVGSARAARSSSRPSPTDVRRALAVRRWTTRTGQIAAALLLTLTLSKYLSDWRYDYHTAPGTTTTVELADGSTVFMKGGAALNVHVDATGARTIELIRGEAFFDVKHDASRPFTVVFGNGVVRDIGTGFSVAHAGRLVTVAVEHGSVEVNGAGTSKVLNANEKVSLDLYTMGRTLDAAKGTVSPWRRGVYVADGKPLGEVLSDLNDYHPGHIVVLSHALSLRRVNAVVQLAHIDRLLDSLNHTSGISVRRWGPLTLVSDGPA